MLTGLVIALLAIVGAATVVGGGMYALQRRADRSLGSGGGPKLLGDGSGGDDLVERGIGDVRVGDIVQYSGRDFLVEGVVHYDEDGHRWRAARMVDGRDERWLIVGLERGGAQTLRFTQIDRELEMSGYPPEQIPVAGATFAQESRGTASARIEGDAGELPRAANGESVLRCRWWRYETAGPKALVVEQWGGLYRALRGEKIGPADIELIPGS